MSDKCIIVLGANQFQRERALIGAEKAADVRVVTVSANAPFHQNKYPATTICSDEANPQRLLVDVEHFLAKTKMTLIGVIPLNDFVLNAGLAVAQQFDLPYHSKHVIEHCRHKDKMKVVLAEADLPVVKSHPFSTVEQAQVLADEVGYPLVIKPLNFGGSGGVKKVNHQDELAAVVSETKAHLAQHAAHYDSDPVRMVMEAYINRPREISVEMISTPDFSAVVGVTEKYLSDEPYFSEIGHLVPSNIQQQPAQFAIIKAIALKACKALGVCYGMAHVEMKVNQDGSQPVIIEVGARPAGDGIMDLYEKAMGTNLYAWHCKAYLGTLAQECVESRVFLNTAAIAYLHPRPGLVDQINRQNLNPDDLANVDLISIKVVKGQTVTTAKNWSTRYGFIEYTFWPTPPKAFNLIARTQHLADQLFGIKEVDEQQIQ